MGQAIMPAAAFQGGSFELEGNLRVRQRRLKTGGSQNWLPHF
jgi:hypothetical protein